MQRNWKRLLVLPLYISCTGFTYEEETVIPAHQEKDECVELKAGATLTYRFESSISAKFDIHRHINEKEVIVLDNAVGTTRRGPKTINIDDNGIYCLNWKNRYNENLQLNFHIEFNNPNL